MTTLLKRSAVLVAVAGLLLSAVQGNYRYVMTSEASGSFSVQGDPSQRCDMMGQQGYECPEGWEARRDSSGVVCLWLSNDTLSWYGANSTCIAKGGNLVTINSMYRQWTVEGALDELPEPVWGGAFRQPGVEFKWPGDVPIQYRSSWAGRIQSYRDHGYPCMSLYDEGRDWRNSLSCDVAARYLCDLVPECSPGYFGKRCQGQCHCYGRDPCPSGRVGEETCPSGCQRGWRGHQCCIQEEEASVAQYCIHDDSGRYLWLRLDTKHVDYNRVTPVDVAGQPLPWCQAVSIAHDSRDHTYLIKVPVVDSAGEERQENCAPDRAGNNTYSWRIALQQKEGLRMPMDKTLLITCDFNDAETLSRGLQYSLGEEEEEDDEGEDDMPDSVEFLIPTREDVVLSVVDPDSGDVVHQAPIGTNVALRMSLNVSEGVTAQGVSPKNCLARSLDGQVTRQLTDSKGCPVESSPVSKLSGPGGTVTSQPFQLFAFRGHKHVAIVCSFEFCFSATQQATCDDRCKTLNRTRQRRDSGEKPALVATRIHVLPGAKSKPSETHHIDDHHAVTARMMTPVTWFLFATLLVVSGALVYVLFLRPPKAVIRRLR